MHDPTPPPEADRGVAVARGHAGVASPDGRRRDPIVPGGELRQCWHDRVSVSGWAVLLHGDEHAHSGRASGDRGGDWSRPCQGTDPRGGWIAADGAERRLPPARTRNG